MIFHIRPYEAIRESGECTKSARNCGKVQTALEHAPAGVHVHMCVHLLTRFKDTHAEKKKKIVCLGNSSLW